jgi:hypothetical protein
MLQHYSPMLPPHRFHLLACTYLLNTESVRNSPCVVAPSGQRGGARTSRYMVVLGEGLVYRTSFLYRKEIGEAFARGGGRTPLRFRDNSVRFRILSQIQTLWIRCQKRRKLCSPAQTKGRDRNICSQRLIRIDPRKWQYPKTGLAQHGKLEAKSHQAVTTLQVQSPPLKVISHRMNGKKQTLGAMVARISCSASEILCPQYVRKSLGCKLNKPGFRPSKGRVKWAETKLISNATEGPNIRLEVRAAFLRCKPLESSITFFAFSFCRHRCNLFSASEISNFPDRR